MMRYVALHRPPRSDDEDWMDREPIAQATTVYECDDRPEPTGLVDVHGTPLYRVRDRVKMGYL